MGQSVGISPGRECHVSEVLPQTGCHKYHTEMEENMTPILRLKIKLRLTSTSIAKHILGQIHVPSKVHVIKHQPDKHLPTGAPLK